MQNQDPKALFKQSLKELHIAFLKLKQANRELNETLDELRLAIIGRWW